MQFVEHKSKADDALIQMVSELEKLLNGRLRRVASIKRNTPKWMRTDGDREYIGNGFQEWLSRRKVLQEVATAYSPESNGAAERFSWTLLDRARATMLWMKVLREELWADAIYTASFLRNQSQVKSSRERRTPYEVIHRKRTSLRHVRIFGSRTCVHEEREVRCGMFDSQALPGILVGYCRGNAYRVMLDGGNAVVESEDVKITENSGVSRFMT